MRKLRPERLNSLNNVTKQINLGVSLVCGHQSSYFFLSIMSPSITNKIKPLLVMEVKYFLAPINSSYLPVICEYYYFLCLIFFCRLLGKQEEGKEDKECLEKKDTNLSNEEEYMVCIKGMWSLRWDRDYIKRNRPNRYRFTLWHYLTHEWEHLYILSMPFFPSMEDTVFPICGLGGLPGAGWFQVVSLIIGKNVA